MQDCYQQWINQIEDLSTSASLRHVDVIVDQAAWEVPLLPALNAIEPPVSWFSLFSRTPEEALLTQAPILMRIQLDDWQHKAWLEEVMEQVGHEPRLMLLISPIPFDALSKALQGLSQLEWGGQSGLLRFYDPRVLPKLLESVLSAEQAQRFLRLALFWSWQDRDHSPVWRQGAYCSDQSLQETHSPVVLTDAQFDRLGCISDAQKLLSVAETDFPELTQEQSFDRFYCLALQAAKENYFGGLDVYAKRMAE